MRLNRIPFDDYQRMLKNAGFAPREECSASSADQEGALSLPFHLSEERATQFQQIYIYESSDALAKARALVEQDISSLTKEKLSSESEYAERLKWLGAELLDLERLGTGFLRDRVFVSILLHSDISHKRERAARVLAFSDSAIARSALFWAAKHDPQLRVRDAACGFFLRSDNTTALDDLAQLANAESNLGLVARLLERITAYDNEESRAVVRNLALRHKEISVRNFTQNNHG